MDTKNPLMKNKYAYRLDEINKFIAHLEAYFSSFPSSTFLPQILNNAASSFDKKADERVPLYSRNFSPELLPAMPTFTKELSPTSAPFRPSSSLADMPSIGSQSSHSESRGDLSHHEELGRENNNYHLNTFDSRSFNTDGDFSSTVYSFMLQLFY